MYSSTGTEKYSAQCYPDIEKNYLLLEIQKGQNFILGTLYYYLSIALTCLYSTSRTYGIFLAVPGFFMAPPTVLFVFQAIPRVRDNSVPRRLVRIIDYTISILFKSWLNTISILLAPRRRNPEFLNSNSESTQKNPTRNRILRSGFGHLSAKMAKLIFKHDFKKPDQQVKICRELISNWPLELDP